MPDSTHQRIEALLIRQAHLERERQGVAAGLPDVANKLLPLLRDAPAVVEGAHAHAVYCVRPTRWTADPDYDADEITFSWDRSAPYDNLDIEVHPALCRGPSVLSSSPRPELQLIENRMIRGRGVTLADIEDEPSGRLHWHPEPIDDFCHAARDDEWRAFAFELHALLATLEQRIGEGIRLYASVNRRIRDDTPPDTDDAEKVDDIPF